MRAAERRSRAMCMSGLLARARVCVCVWGEWRGALEKAALRARGEARGGRRRRFSRATKGKDAERGAAGA